MTKRCKMLGMLEQNRAILNKRHPEISADWESADISGLRLFPSANGPLTVSAISEGKEKTLHSRYDPKKEAEAQIKTLHPPENAVVLFWGMGLGYHVVKAIENLSAETPVAVVEKDAGIFRLAMENMDLSPLLDRDAVLLLVDPSVDGAEKALSRFQMAHGFAPFKQVEHLSAVRLHENFYRNMKDRFPDGEGSFTDKMVYPRFTKASHRILLLSTGYYLVREIEKAIKALGHDLRIIPIEDKKAGNSETIKALLQTTAEFKPDFVLTVNHLGFDANGVLTELLDQLRLPFASWFVDSPLFILGAGRGLVSDYASIFLWDRDYMDQVKTLGFDRVTYLPLATDETVFKPNARVPEFDCPAGFVGNSMVKPVRDKMALLGIAMDRLPTLDRAARDFIRQPDRVPGRIIRRLDLPGELGLKNLSREQWLELEGLVTWRATGLYRLELVKALSPFGPSVIGDGGWRESLPQNGFRLRPPLDYYTELPQFYPACKINLNATSLQMKTGVNQRVFDVPATGGFLLTDKREQLNDLFDPETEVVQYADAEELADLARFYLSHDRQRSRISERAGQRVLAEHTYRHRLTALIDRMAKDFG